MSTTPTNGDHTDDVERDDRVRDTITTLAHSCDGCNMTILLEAASRFLAILVVTHTKTAAGLDAFMELFQDTLREEWQVHRERHETPTTGPQLN